MERDRPDVMYLSTTDYIQHKHAPGTQVANDFYAMLDRYLAQLDALGCTIVLTADHGMNAKHDADGKPDVIYLQDLLDDWLGDGRGPRHPADHRSLRRASRRARLVRHRLSAEGSRVRRPICKIARCRASRWRSTRDEACARFELPDDRIGDIVVVSTRHKMLGTSAVASRSLGPDEPLRSHGGITEQRVPLIVNRSCARRRPRPGATSTPSTSRSTSC